MGTGKSKRRVVKTLYVENIGNPLRIELTEEHLKRIRRLQSMATNLSLKRNESVELHMRLRKGTVIVSKGWIDIGTYGYEGWDSYICEKELHNIDELPEVYFSSMFLYYMKDDLEGRKEAYNKLILPKHKELIVWKKIEGEA